MHLTTSGIVRQRDLCRTEAAELRAATLQAEAALAQASQRQSADEQRAQEAALRAVEEKLRDARVLVVWQERRIAELEHGDAYQAVRG